MTTLPTLSSIIIAFGGVLPLSTSALLAGNTPSPAERMSMPSPTQAPGELLWQSPANAFTDGQSRYFRLVGDQLARLDRIDGHTLWSSQMTGLRPFANFKALCTSKSGLLISQESERLVARSSETGATVWSILKTASDRAICSTAHDLILDGPDSSGHYQGYSLSDGRQLWTGSTGPVGSWVSFAEDNGSLYLSFYESSDLVDWRTVAIDPLAGQARATYMCPDSHNIPLISNKTVLCSASDGSVSRLDTTTGQVAWTAHIGSSEASLTVRPDSEIVAFTNDGSEGAVNLLKAATGETLWSFSYTNAYPKTSVLEGNESLLVFAGNSSANGSAQSILLDAAGKVLWEKPFVVEALRGAVYHYNRDGLIEQFDLRSGAFNWAYQASDPIIGLLPSAADELFVATGSYPRQGIMALDRQSGRRLWETAKTLGLEASRGGLSSKVEVDDGSVYVYYPSGLAVISRAAQ